MWMVLGGALLIIWATAFLIARVTSLTVHLLLLAGMGLVVMHFVEKRRRDQRE